MPIPAGTETILLAEDKKQVRGIAVRRLESLGYRVVKAGDANAAMCFIREEIAIDLLFTDIIIRGELDGHKLAQWATGARPGLKAAQTTGQHLDVWETRPGAEFALLKNPILLNSSPVLSAHNSIKTTEVPQPNILSVNFCTGALYMPGKMINIIFTNLHKNSHETYYSVRLKLTACCYICFVIYQDFQQICGVGL